MDAQQFELDPPGKQVLLFPLLIGVVFPLGVVAALALAAPRPVPWATLWPVALMPIIGAALARTMMRRSLRLDDAGLRLRDFPWPRTVPVADFELERAEIVDLESRPELMPRIKIAGSRLPGYRSGFFRLRDKRKAHVRLTNLRRVLVLPRRDGSLVMLSLLRPESLLQALRQRAGKRG